MAASVSISRESRGEQGRHDLRQQRTMSPHGIGTMKEHPKRPSVTKTRDWIIVLEFLLSLLLPFGTLFGMAKQRSARASAISLGDNAGQGRHASHNESAPVVPLQRFSLNMAAKQGHLQHWLRPTARRLAAALLLGAIMLSAGCRPIVIGNNIFAVGCYDHRQYDVSEHSHVTETNGIGVLIMPGRFILGYARVATLCSSKTEDDLAVRFDRAEVYLGAAADREARRMAREAVTRALAQEREESP